ncbi:MAG: SBBP repeat-containing protein [bacterium]
MKLTIRLTPLNIVVILVTLFSWLLYESSFAGVLAYSTYLGSGVGYSIAVDGSRSVYITGETYSSSFPTTLGAFDTSYNGNGDIFVTKLNASGTALVYSTLLGGSGEDYSYGIAVDSSGNAYITGQSSPGFPTTPGAFDTTYHGVFVTKVDSTGTTLVYSTYLGNGVGYSIAVDGSGNAYITGYTSSTDFPTTPGALDTSSNSSAPYWAPDGFVTKLNPSGTALVYSTFLGGGGGEEAWGIAIDASGNTYITGYTSTDFPTTPSAFDTSSHGGVEGFVSKLNTSGTALVYSTYLGGGADDAGRGIAVDGSGNAYIAGATNSTDYPTTTDAFDTSLNGGSYDVFVTKLNSSGTALIYSTYLGGESDDWSYGIAVDDFGNTYINGKTQSTNFPTTLGAFDISYNGGGSSSGGDIFVSQVNASGTALLYSTYLGGYDDDWSYGIAMDGSENGYITGYTSSSNFPTTPSAFSTIFNGPMEAFVSKIYLGPLSVDGWLRYDE